jgi:hypothetical protein
MMSDRMFVATRKGVFVIERASGGWSVAHAAFVGDNCSYLCHDPRDGSLYAALGHGHFGVKVHRSTDGGKNWSEVATPTYPPKPDDVPDVMDPMRQKPIPWSLEMVWTIVPGAAGQSGRLWAGTLPGGLFRSDDHGASWTLVRSLWDVPNRKHWFGGGYDYPGIHSIMIDPRDPNRVIVGVSCGGVWASENDGESWANCAQGMRAEYMPPERQFDPDIQDPHLVVQCAGQPDVLWAQHHNGIFRTTDNLKSWSEIKTARPAAFGFAVAVHPVRGDTAWFAPAIKDEKRVPVDGKVVISRTRDGGQTFEVLRNGLPQEHAYDLTFRHALDVDESGDRLAFGSTTGSLWVSEDQGDSWKTVSANLPPIYSVRFAKPA